MLNTTAAARKRNSFTAFSAWCTWWTLFEALDKTWDVNCSTGILLSLFSDDDLIFGLVLVLTLVLS